MNNVYISRQLLTVQSELGIDIWADSPRPNRSCGGNLVTRIMRETHDDRTLHGMKMLSTSDLTQKLIRWGIVSYTEGHSLQMWEAGNWKAGYILDGRCPSSNESTSCKLASFTGPKGPTKVIKRMRKEGSAYTVSHMRQIFMTFREFVFFVKLFVTLDRHQSSLPNLTCQISFRSDWPPSWSKALASQIGQFCQFCPCVVL